MITVIVTTRNSERTLPACLAALVPAAVDAIVREVIVVDGGSTDATLAIAEDAGAKLAAGMAEAAAAAKADWLLILPAIVRLETGWDAEAAAHLQRHERRSAQFCASWWPLAGRKARGLLSRKDRFGKPLGRLRRMNSRAFVIDPQ